MGNIKDHYIENRASQVKYNRRDFIKKMAIGGSTVILFGCCSPLQRANGKAKKDLTCSMILVDYSKCTGCRTCETVCSAYNHKRLINGEALPGLGNPHYSNIKIYSYNPDLDIPVVCAMCPDNPCIEACPVASDPKTGRKALYRDEKTLAIKNDLNRCTGCGNCVEACQDQRAGVIITNPETNKPEGMCTLCDGDPQCVKYCPYGALSYVTVSPGREFQGVPADKISKKLAKRWYSIQN